MNIVNFVNIAEVCSPLYGHHREGLYIAWMLTKLTGPQHMYRQYNTRYSNTDHSILKSQYFSDFLQRVSFL